MTVYFGDASDYGLNEWSSRDSGFSQWQGDHAQAGMGHDNWNNWDVKSDPWPSKAEQGFYDQFAIPAWRGGWSQDQTQAQGQGRPEQRRPAWANVSAQVFAHRALAEEPREVLVVNSSSSGAHDSLCRDAAKADVVAFDCEWVPDWEYGSDNPISVMQLAFPSSSKCYVVQLGPLNRRLPQDVQMMLVNPEVTKVGFAVSHKDSAKLAISGIAVTQGSVVDVQEQCAAAMGLPWERAASLSLKRAANELLGCKLLKDKRCACSDWSCEKLTPEQVRYAALDAWVALRLYYLPQ